MMGHHYCIVFLAEEEVEVLLLPGEEKPGGGGGGGMWVGCSEKQCRAEGKEEPAVAMWVGRGGGCGGAGWVGRVGRQAGETGGHGQALSMTWPHRCQQSGQQHRQAQAPNIHPSTCA